MGDGGLRDREPGLPGSARAGQGDQARHLQPTAELGQLALAPDDVVSRTGTVTAGASAGSGAATGLAVLASISAVRSETLAAFPFGNNVQVHGCSRPTRHHGGPAGRPRLEPARPQRRVNPRRSGVLLGDAGHRA